MNIESYVVYKCCVILYNFLTSGISLGCMSKATNDGTLDALIEKVIAEVMKNVPRECGISLTEDNKTMYYGFLQRQLKVHPEYCEGYRPDSERNKYISLLLDIVQIFAYLSRQKKVKQHISDAEGTLIDTDEKLRLLRVRGNEYCLWDDEKLCLIYITRKSAVKFHSLSGYTALIDEIGKDQEVVRVWGRELCYANDVSAMIKKYRGRNR